MLNAREFAQLANLRAANDGDKPFFTESEIQSVGEGTNWQKEVLQNAPVQNHVLTLTGGNEKTQFAVSGNYFAQEGILKGSNFWRGQLRTSLQHKINNVFSLSFNGLLNRIERNQLNSDNTVRGQGVLSGALIAPPTIRPYNAAGDYNSISIYPFSPDVAENPLAIERLNMVKRRAYGFSSKLPSTIDYPSTGWTASSFRDAVVQERAYEQFMEGKRWLDLKRTGKAAEKILAAKGLTIKEAHYLWPIPKQEIDTNPALSQKDQNPGY